VPGTETCLFQPCRCLPAAGVVRTLLLLTESTESNRPVPPPLPGFRQRLLPTPPDIVPVHYVAALRSFCAAIAEIEAAYVCAVEIDREGAEPDRALRFSVKLVSPVDTRDDSRAELFAIAMSFGESHPELMRELGCSMLADRAVPAYEQFGLRVY
jgi:hypothetical protein